MFDFEKLEVYLKAKRYNHSILQFLHSVKLDSVIRNQLRRASLSIVLNIAEGTSRFSKPDRRNFYVIARGSVFECVAILDILNSESMIEEEFHSQQYKASEELSKMLMGLIKSLQ